LTREGYSTRVKVTFAFGAVIILEEGFARLLSASNRAVPATSDARVRQNGHLQGTSLWDCISNAKTPIKTTGPQDLAILAREE